MTAAAPKPRPRRIAADEAHAWARNLRLRNPYAKLLLCMLTQYVNGEGTCFVAITTLAEDCELSTGTIRSRLAWLENVGAIARFPQWIDDAGKRNGDGRGKRTSDDIRLILTADPDAIEARATGDADYVEADESVNVSPARGEGLNPSPEPVRTPVALQQPSNCVEGLDSSEPEPEDSPQAPQGGPSDASPDGWEDFKTTFEADGDPILKVTLAKSIFSALTVAERQQATRAAKGLIAKRGRDKKPGTKPSAQSFLREREAWEAFEKLEQQAAETADRRIVTEDSREGRAWRALWRMAGHLSPVSFSSQGRQCFSVRSLSAQHLALADCIDERGQPIGKWISVDAGSNEAGAWRRLVSDTIGRSLNPHYGVPAPFPPRADGTWPEFQLKQTA